MIEKQGDSGSITVRVPGDKSITQRVLILSSLALGESRLRGLLHGGDAESTAQALRLLGVPLPDIPRDGSEIRVTGVGLDGLNSPPQSLDLGNSGTGVRLLLGVLAGSGVEATLVGDISLSTRPMGRVCEPLREMGAYLDHLEVEGCLPIQVRPSSSLRSIEWLSPVPSAQVKSSILLAGLLGGTDTTVIEERRSRDHTERLLAETGASVSIQNIVEGHQVKLNDPPRVLTPLNFRVPGDVSSAAFIVGLAALGGTRMPVTLIDVSLNPTRTGFLDVFSRMGVSLKIENAVHEHSCEPRGSIITKRSMLNGTDVSPSDVPSVIDEIPVIAVMAACSEGSTTIRGAGELRLKESDRIYSLTHNLRSLGVPVTEYEDGLVIKGTRKTLKGSVQTFGDHRIAMAFGILGQLGENEIEIEDSSLSDVSFPGFWNLLHELTQPHEIE